MDAQKVEALRRAYHAGGVTQEQLAERYDTAQSYVSAMFAVFCLRKWAARQARTTAASSPHTMPERSGSAMLRGESAAPSLPRSIRWLRQASATWSTACSLRMRVGRYVEGESVSVSASRLPGPQGPAYLLSPSRARVRPNLVALCSGAIRLPTPSCPISHMV